MGLATPSKISLGAIRHRFMDNVVKNASENAYERGSALTKPAIARGCVVREGGLEPPHLTAQDPKSCVSTSSTTLAIFSG